MTATEFLGELQRRGIELRVADGKLRYKAPPGTMTDKVRAWMKYHKDELIRLITYKRVSPCEHCGTNNWRYEPLAFDQAGGHVCMTCSYAVQ